jgi:hypothetical protein
MVYLLNMLILHSRLVVTGSRYQRVTYSVNNAGNTHLNKETPNFKEHIRSLPQKKQSQKNNRRVQKKKRLDRFRILNHSTIKAPDPWRLMLNKEHDYDMI